MGTKKKRDGWFFNKSIIDEINGVSDQAAAEISDEEIIPPELVKNDPESVAKEGPSEHEQQRVQTQIDLLKSKLQEMEHLSKELHDANEEITLLKAERDQLQMQSEDQKHQIADLNQQLVQLQQENTALRNQRATDAGQAENSLSAEEVSTLMATLVQEKQYSAELLARLNGLEQQSMASHF